MEQVMLTSRQAALLFYVETKLFIKQLKPFALAWKQSAHL
jgi:hypothetical protein